MSADEFISDYKKLYNVTIISEYDKPPTDTPVQHISEPEYNPKIVNKIKNAAASKGIGPMSGEELFNLLGIED